jgi:hypothetical protein
MQLASELDRRCVLRIVREARNLGVYAVEHAAPGFLGSLALLVT